MSAKATKSKKLSEVEGESRFPEIRSLERWVDRLTPLWADFKTSELTDADHSVLIKIVMMGMVEKRTSSTLSQPGSPITLRVTYDASGFDTLPEFFKRDVYPLVPEWNVATGIANRPDDAFKARLTSLGESEKQVLTDLAANIDAGAEVTEETAGVDLLASIRGTLSMIAEYAPRRYARIVDYSRVEAGGEQETFVPNDFQNSILQALDGVALKKQDLANKVCGGEGSRLYKPGGIKELMERKLVTNKPRLGYFRPSNPPQ